MFWRRVLSAATLASLFFAALTISKPTTASAKPVPKNDSVSDPQLLDLAGYKAMVAQYHGRPLLVTFWATWCAPCRDEYPMIQTLAKEYAAQGLAVVGVSLDADQDMTLVRHFIAQTHPEFPNFRQKQGIDMDAFYNGVNPDWKGEMPQTDFYARDGHLARYFTAERNRDAFVEAIRIILASPNAENGSSRTPTTGN